MSCVINSLISMLIGAFVTWYVARKYYFRSSGHLKSEAEELRRLSNLMLRGMEYAGWVDLNRDNQGNIRGFIVKLQGKVVAKSEISGSLKVQGKT